MFDLKFIAEIKFSLFPENCAMYKALTSNNFKMNKDRKTAVFIENKCDKMFNYVKFRHLKLNLYLDEFCDYFKMNRNTNFYDF